MKVNIESLTQEQKRMLDLGYKFSVTEDGKLMAEEPAEVTPELIEYKKELIEKEFQDNVKAMTCEYSQSEIDSWTKKVEEAKKVIAGEESEFLSAILTEGEELMDFANLIMQRHDIYSLDFAKAEGEKRQKLKELLK